MKYVGRFYDFCRLLMSCKFPQVGSDNMEEARNSEVGAIPAPLSETIVTIVITYNQRSRSCLNRTPKECTATTVAVSLKLTSSPKECTATTVAVSLKLTSSPKPNETSACRQRTPEKTATLLFRIKSIFALFVYLFAIYLSICVLLNSTIRAPINPLKPELNSICYLLALLAHHFLHVSRIRGKSLTLRLLMSYIYGAHILDVSRSHTTTQHSR